MKSIRKWTLMLAGAVLSLPVLMNAAVVNQPQSTADLQKKIRHELVMLPWYNIFDNFQFRVDDAGNVTLLGQVTRPTLKSDAASVVRHIPGVASVRNEIEVLPLSSMDDQIRMATYRSIYGFSALNRYAMGSVPSIHIIVKNGNVTLAGVVANETDKNIAYIRANAVSGVFAVTNDLQVENLSR
ncbi:MAG TPA: BON domain-containing protein [Bryobacteraceae bacterium]|nr:BON domain-containing protein [Bryobacteraceae bacterium]